VVQDFGRFLRHPLTGPWREISANIYHAGFQALGITALVGFLIGVVLSYLSAQQLRTFGGDIYLVNILGMSRDPRTGAAAGGDPGRRPLRFLDHGAAGRDAGDRGTRCDAGDGHLARLPPDHAESDRAGVAMPLLVVWTDAMALIGGMVSAKVELGLTARYFIQKLPSAVPVVNYSIGLGKGVAFGMLIALVSCHFGLRIKPNTESLGRGTTTSVVTAITVVILADAVFAIVFSGVGF
jgi:phospholipid/cholesterol/gamma-HCH transport system permease protein